MPISLSGYGDGYSTEPVWRSKLFVITTEIVIPPDVGMILIDGCSAGGGGGGGDPTPGGGGGGGGPGMAIRGFRQPVSPGDVLSVVIGAVGAGGVAGQDGGASGASKILKNDSLLISLWALGGAKGTAGAGGAGGYLPYGGTAFAGLSISGKPNYMPISAFTDSALAYYSGSSGGALNVAGGATVGDSLSDGFYLAGGSGGSSGGGGGRGGVGPYALKGVTYSGNSSNDIAGNGGNNGAAGTNGNGYGSGGGGGSGDAAGGNGAPGFFEIFYLSAYPMEEA